MKGRTSAKITIWMRESRVARTCLRGVRNHATGWEWASVAVEAFLMYLVISAFIVRAYAIPSGSMRPTLKEGDRIFVNKFVYMFRGPYYGDIVVFRTPKSIYTPEKPEFVKRVVGLPNNFIQIRHPPLDPWGHLWINDHPPPDGNPVRDISYLSRLDGTIFEGKTVPPGEIYVFGDNSANSYDSRFWGGVPLQNLRGKAFFRFWPPSRVGMLR